MVSGANALAGDAEAESLAQLHTKAVQLVAVHCNTVYTFATNSKHGLVRRHFRPTENCSHMTSNQCESLFEYFCQLFHELSKHQEGALCGFSDTAIMNSAFPASMKSFDWTSFRFHYKATHSTISMDYAFLKATMVFWNSFSLGLVNDNSFFASKISSHHLRLHDETSLQHPRNLLQLFPSLKCLFAYDL